MQQSRCNPSMRVAVSQPEDVYQAPSSSWRGMGHMSGLEFQLFPQHLQFLQEIKGSEMREGSIKISGGLGNAILSYALSGGSCAALGVTKLHYSAPAPIQHRTFYFVGHFRPSNGLLLTRAVELCFARV